MSTQQELKEAYKTGQNVGSAIGSANKSEMKELQIEMCKGIVKLSIGTPSNSQAIQVDIGQFKPIYDMLSIAYEVQ